MSKKRNPDQLLLDLAHNEGSAVAHLPYSDEFEAVCRQINPKATTEDKHRIWEKLLDLGQVDISVGEVAASLGEPSIAVPAHTFPIPVEPMIETSRTSQENGLLFAIHDPIALLQPWSASGAPNLSPAQAERRQKLLANIANSRLAKSEEKVAYVLQRFPETRDSDTSLCIRYWKMFQADVLERWQPLELEVLFELDRIETLGRVRRMIQHDLGLFRGIEDNQRARNARQRELHEYLQAHRDSLPEVRFYLDETGNEGDKSYLGIAGICVINWKQFEKHSAALEKWRSKQGPETIHFSDTGAEKLDQAVSLLRELKSRRSGVLFLGYSLASRGRTSNDLASLFIQLVVDSLKHLRECGCLKESRSVRVIKEADPGFDSFYLLKMTKELEEMIAQEFPDQLTVQPIEAVTKGRTVLLECADLIAGGMQRRALHKGWKPKDKLAEAVINVTGFEDSADPGAIFKYHAAKG